MFGFKKSQPPARRRPGVSPPSRPDAFSYYANRAKTEQGSQRRLPTVQTPKISWIRQLPTYVALAAIGISLVLCLSLDTNPKIVQLNDLVAPNQRLRDSRVYQAAAKKILSQHLSSRTKLTIDTQAVITSLKQQFPEISQAYINIPLISRRPVFSLQLAEPQLLFNEQGGQSFVLDKSGRVIMSARDIQKLGGYHLLTVTDQSGLQPKVNEVIMPAQSVAFIRELDAQLVAKKLSIQALSLPAIANELHLRISGINYFVKFNMAEDARLQAGTFLAVKERLEGEHITPAEYIDVRVPEKAYYK